MAARSVNTTAGYPSWLGGWHGTRLNGAAILQGLRRVWQVATTRHLLAEMDDRMLADIGVSRAEAQLEGNRAPWDVATRRN